MIFVRLFGVTAPPATSTAGTHYAVFLLFAVVLAAVVSPTYVIADPSHYHIFLSPTPPAPIAPPPPRQAPSPARGYPLGYETPKEPDGHIAPII